MKKVIEKNKSRSRFIIRIVVLLLITFGFFATGVTTFAYFNLFLSQGNGPAGLTVESEPFEHIWSKNNVLFLGIGDSITAGFGVRDGFSYFNRLVNNPPDDSPDMAGKNLSKVFPNLKVRNIAVSGSNSFAHESQIQNLEVQPRDVMGIVVLTTGGNDLIHNYGKTLPKEGAMYGASFGQAEPWIKKFDKRLNQMIIDINKKFPGGCYIFLANIYDPSDGTGKTNTWVTGLPSWPDVMQILKAYNDIISGCTTKYENVHLVNIHNLFLGHGIHCKKFWGKHYRPKDPYFWYSLIIEDPNSRGYDAIRRAFLIEMSKVLRNKSIN